MLLENDIVPYKGSMVPSGRWLVFAPHPDDETFGMGGSIYLGSSIGREIHVIFVTSGDKGGDPFLREKEAVEALSILGVSSKNIRFWRFPDRETGEHLGKLLKMVETLDCAKFNAVFIPSPMEIHPDHRVVSRVVFEVLKRSRFKGEVWFYEVSRHSEANRLIVIDEALSEKMEAMKKYKTQIAQRPYIDIALSINRARALTLEGVSTVEAFWVYRSGDSLPLAFAKYWFDLNLKRSDKVCLKILEALWSFSF